MFSWSSSVGIAEGVVVGDEAVVVCLLEVLVVFEAVALAATKVEEEGEAEACDEDGTIKWRVGTVLWPSVADEGCNLPD